MRLDCVIQGDDTVQRHFASEHAKQSLRAISPMARKAIRLEVLPQIEESVLSVDSAEELCNDTKRAIEAAFSYKNPLYTRLVNYKGIEQSDEQFLADLLVVMDEWFRKTRAQLQDNTEDSEASEETSKKEVEVTVKVEAEGSEVEFHDEKDLPKPSKDTSPPKVQFHDTKEGPRVRVEGLKDLKDLPDLIDFQDDQKGWTLELDPADLFDLSDLGG